MKFSAYVVSATRADPQQIVWMEPIAWNARGDPTHFQKKKAFVSETKILGGFRYVVRAMTMRILPPELQ